MLDIARVLIDRNESFDNSVIFCKSSDTIAADISVERRRGCVLIFKCYTHPLETLQDGSHLYSTSMRLLKSKFSVPVHR
jgi:hypothetical protein